MGNVWRLATHTCASVQRATGEPCVTTRTTLPTPAQPSSATMGNATSQIEGSPTACASLASVAITVSKVSLLSLWDGGCAKETGVEGADFSPEWTIRYSEEEAMHGGLSDRPREVTVLSFPGH